MLTKTSYSSKSEASKLFHTPVIAEAAANPIRVKQQESINEETLHDHITKHLQIPVKQELPKKIIYMKIKPREIKQ